MKNMTALVSAFSRAYHSAENEVKIFDDPLASKLLTDGEYSGIAEQMAKGIGFFAPGFEGSCEQALRLITDEFLSPSPLGRAAFAENALSTAVKTGARQYMIFGSGYDTFAYRQPDFGKEIEIFELDLPEVIEDKKQRLKNAGLAIAGNVHFIAIDLTSEYTATKILRCSFFDKEKITFCGLLGLAYYLPREKWSNLLASLGKLLPHGSSAVFDYPDEKHFTAQAGERAKKQLLLAGGAGEDMKSGYSFEETEKLLEGCGYLAYEHLTPDEITAQYFSRYNVANPQHKMTAFDNVNYCLACNAKKFL